MNAVLASTNSSILAKQRLQLHAWLAQVKIFKFNFIFRCFFSHSQKKQISMNIILC